MTGPSAVRGLRGEHGEVGEVVGVGVAAGGLAVVCPRENGATQRGRLCRANRALAVCVRDGAAMSRSSSTWAKRASRREGGAWMRRMPAAWKKGENWAMDATVSVSGVSGVLRYSRTRGTARPLPLLRVDDDGDGADKGVR